eukprot:6020864-Karenia_brevis.AAC.1
MFENQYASKQSTMEQPEKKQTTAREPDYKEILVETDRPTRMAPGQLEKSWRPAWVSEIKDLS